MNKKRRPRKRYIRTSPRNCERAWSIAERLAYYSKSDPLSGCHIWHGYLKDGYGCLYFRNKLRFAHRLAWGVKHGPISDGLVLRHRCNVRRCCNPDHLVPGTRAENNADQKVERLRLADARAATAPSVAGSAPDLAAIRIFYHGVELQDEVAIRVVDPELAKVGRPQAVLSQSEEKRPARPRLQRQPPVRRLAEASSAAARPAGTSGVRRQASCRRTA